MNEQWTDDRINDAVMKESILVNVDRLTTYYAMSYKAAHLMSQMRAEMQAEIDRLTNRHEALLAYTRRLYAEIEAMPETPALGLLLDDAPDELQQ